MINFYDRSKRVTSDGTGATTATAVTTTGAAALGAASSGSAGITANANDFESSTSENK
jgi:hypothetical protein